MSTDLAGLVARERLRRGLTSVRKAALRASELGAPLSNETWSNFERTGRVTDSVRHAVATTFGWQDDWPEHPPPELEAEAEEREILKRLTRLERKVDRVLKDQASMTEQAVNAASIGDANRTVLAHLAELMATRAEEMGQVTAALRDLRRSSRRRDVADPVHD